MTVSAVAKSIGVALVTLSLCHCGPVTKQVISIRREPYDPADYKQTKAGSCGSAEAPDPDSSPKRKTGSNKKANAQPEPTRASETVTVELDTQTAALPPTFTAAVQKCTNQGMLSVDSLGQPVMEQVPLIPDGYWIQKVAITNDTKHVVRLSGAVIKLFDPSASQYDFLGYEDLTAILQSVRGCPSTMQAIGQLKLIPLVNRNVEIVPRTTFTGYLVFRPADYASPPKQKVTGVWKVALYEIPVCVDKKGDVTETTEFDIRTKVVRRECTIEYPDYPSYMTGQNAHERDCRDEQ